jgi:addiction module RelE/StbE family toxin
VTRIVWTPQAVKDLLGIREYITKDSLQYADLVARSLFGAADRLQHFPESGRIVPELPATGLREVLWRSYRIVYRFKKAEDRIEVLLVFRAERLIPSIPPQGGGA